MHFTTQLEIQVKYQRTNNLIPKQNRVKGAQADFLSGVKINKVGDGYFSSDENFEVFISRAILPILKHLPKKINMVDLGGGDGFLAKKVYDFLLSPSAHWTGLAPHWSGWPKPTASPSTPG